MVERQKQIEVQAEEIRRRERELEATVRKPAEAERYRLETVAAGEKARIVAQAEGEAQATRLSGEAQADAIRARGVAEAEAMERKAEAWRNYGQAAVIQQLLETLPQLAKEVAQPLAKTEKIVIVSTGGSDSDGAGASKVTADVIRTIAQLPQLVESLTGIDILSTLKNLPGVVSSEAAGAAKQSAAENRGTAAEASDRGV